METKEAPKKITVECNYDSVSFSSIEEGIEQLRKKNDTRNQMGGAMYFNILSEDCAKIANAIHRNFQLTPEQYKIVSDLNNGN